MGNTHSDRAFMLDALSDLEKAKIYTIHNLLLNVSEKKDEVAALLLELWRIEFKKHNKPNKIYHPDQFVVFVKHHCGVGEKTLGEYLASATIINEGLTKERGSEKIIKATEANTEYTNMKCKIQQIQTAEKEQGVTRKFKSPELWKILQEATQVFEDEIGNNSEKTGVEIEAAVEQLEQVKEGGIVIKCTSSSKYVNVFWKK